MAFLAFLESGHAFIGANESCRPPYNPPELGSQGSKHRWETGCMMSCRLGVRVQTYPRRESAHPTGAHPQDHTGGKGRSRREDIVKAVWFASIPLPFGENLYFSPCRRGGTIRDTYLMGQA
jgi:hypothetical protein